MPDEDRNWTVAGFACPVCGAWSLLERKNLTRPADLRKVVYRLRCSAKHCHMKTDWCPDSHSARLAWKAYCRLAKP